MSDVHLKLTNVHRHFGDGEHVINVLDQADLAVRSGEIVALVAPSGAGKSTLLHVGGLLERPQVGEVEICGEATSKLSDRARTFMRRTGVGYVYQFHNLLPEFTALENVTMPQLIEGQNMATANARSAELLDLLGIGDRATHRPAELSGGEQQRVAIARATANNPRIVLADEPTGNLDPATSEAVFASMAGLIKDHGAAALIATHNYDIARKADRIVTLEQGRVVPTTL